MPFEIGGTEVTTGASIGIALGQAGPASPEDLMRNADLALYDAKNAGKNRYAVFAPTMHEAALARLSLTSDLRHAIERGELVVYYQPLVDLDVVARSSASRRWSAGSTPTLGMLLPGQFIALAEETGLIVPLGRLVLQTALRDTVRWQRDHETHRDAAHRRQRQRPPAAGPEHRRRRPPRDHGPAASSPRPSSSRSPRASCCRATA